MTTRHDVHSQLDEGNISFLLAQFVDINGSPLRLPLATARMIVYRVWKAATESTRNEEATRYHLELVTRPELREFCGR